MLFAREGYTFAVDCVAAYYIENLSVFFAVRSKRLPTLPNVVEEVLNLQWQNKPNRNLRDYQRNLQ